MANTPKEMLNFIDSKLKGRTVGYEIAIHQGTALVLSTSGGSAVLGSSPTAMTSKKRTLVGSMSKTITAATVVPLLSALNGSYPKLSVESKISPFLPSSWKRGPNVDQITFRMLLTHTSGLPNAAWDYAGLKALIEAGVPALLPAPPAYSNSGYCLLRVIIPFLSMSPAMKKKVEKDPNVNLPKFLGDQYVDRARAVLTGDGIDVVPNGDKPYTVYYNFKDQTKTYQIPNDNRLYAGAGGWIMSAREYGRFLAEMQFGSLKTFWETMRDTPAPSIFEPEPAMGATPRLGMWRFPGKEGFYFGHNGEQGSFDNKGVAIATGFGGWMVYPNGTTAVLLANSNRWFPEEQEWNILLPAYDS